jgi:two-component system, OmpR family, sensor histidine kinase KdpD
VRLVARPQVGLGEVAVGALASAGAVAFVTAAIEVARPYVPVLSLGVLYVFAVLPVAVAWGLAYAVPVSIASMLAFNWFFLPPTHTFSLREGGNWFALAVYLVTAVVVSTLAASSRRRAREAEQRAREAALLARISTALLQGSALGYELEQIAAQAAQVLKVTAASIELRPGDAAEETRFPLVAGGREVGALVVPSQEQPDPAVRERFLPSLASLLAVAIDRDELEREAVAAEALRRSDAVKTAVLRAVSHDLRSPLTAISAAVSGLEDPGLELDERDRAGLLETIRLESDRLGRLVEDLLDLSRLEAGAVRPRRELWRVDELVGRALDALGELGRVEVELERGLPLVEVDAAQVERVLANVIGNALKFSPPSTPVRVRGRSGDGTVVLEVLDDGAGLPPAELEVVFEPFSRGSAASAPGAGLGLAIARGFVEANGGHVWAEEADGGRFLIELPAPSGKPVPA